MKPFLCEPYLSRLRDETAPARSSGALVAHLWARGLLDARFDTLLLPVWVAADPPDSADPLADHLAARGLPRDFARERLASGACLVILESLSPALERRYPKCLFVTDADGLLQSSRTCH